MDRPEFSNRTWLCTVVFLDIVEYSKQSVARQMAMKRRFNAQLAEVIAHVAVRDRIVLDTGDGAAICFMGDPEEALLVALRLLHAFRDEAKSELLPILVRIGIHIGPLNIYSMKSSLPQGGIRWKRHGRMRPPWSRYARRPPRRQQGSLPPCQSRHGSRRPSSAWKLLSARISAPSRAYW